MKTNKVKALVFAVMVVSACSEQQILNDVMHEPDLASVIPQKKKINTSVQHEINSFEYIVTEILTTSPRFKQLTRGLYSQTLKNEGLSYGINMEGSPNHIQDMTWTISRNYDFSVYEVSSAGKITAGYFSFNPRNKQLYEYNAAKNRLYVIKFDKNLLVKYDRLLTSEL